MNYPNPKPCPACNQQASVYSNSVEDDRHPIGCSNERCPLFDKTFYESEWKRIGECCVMVARINCEIPSEV